MRYDSLPTLSTSKHFAWNMVISNGCFLKRGSGVFIESALNCSGVVISSFESKAIDLALKATPISGASHVS